MAVSRYLLRILSQPTDGDVAAWTKTCCSEILPALTQSHAVTRATFFHAFEDFPLATKTPDAGTDLQLGDETMPRGDFEPPEGMQCLAMCQIDSPTPPKSATEVRQGVAVDVRVYRLIQEYDPRGIGHTPAPFSLQVQCEPRDDDDYNNFYVTEHLFMLERVPGYRRSQRYQLVLALGTDVDPAAIPRFIAVHEFEQLNDMDGPEQREADASPNTHRVIMKAKSLNVRGFKLVQAFGDMVQ